MTAPPVMIQIMCGKERDGWITPGLMARTLEATSDGAASRRPVLVNLTQGVMPVEKARNQAVTDFLKSPCSWLLMLDNDVIPAPHFLHMIRDAENEGKSFVGAPCPMIGDHGVSLNVAQRKDNLRCDFYNRLPAGFTRCDYIGAACIAVHRRVLEKLKAPWFEWGQTMSEDFNFCRKAQDAGFSLWAHGSYLCSHLHTVNLADILNSTAKSAGCAN